MTGVIYKATHNETGRSYIGQTTWGLEWRKRRHEYLAKHPEDCHHSYFHSALAHHGTQSFAWTILKTVPVHELTEQEEAAFREHNTIAPHGYNISSTGDTNRSIVSNKRRRDEDEGLPRHMFVIRKQGVPIGYGCTLHLDNKMRRTSFVSKRFDMPQKLAMAHQWLDDACNGKLPTRCSRLRRNPANDKLPRGICVVTKFGVALGYTAYSRPHKKAFITSWLSMEEKLAQAKSWLSGIKPDCNV